MSKRDTNVDEQRDYIAEQLSVLHKNYHEKFKDADDSYLSYILFCVVGGLIIEHDGLERFQAYIDEILNNQKRTRDV